MSDHRWQITLEWLCLNCVPGFVEALTPIFPSDTDILTFDSLPDEATDPAAPLSEFVLVPTKTVELENGNRIPVRSFVISRSPVTVEQFERFASDTGYTTIAEQDGPEQTYLNNGTIAGFSRQEAAESHATCITFEDAMAYCNANGVRLPSEAEWMAASLFLPDSSARSGMNDERALTYAMFELTATEEGDSIVLRCGPHYRCPPNWRELVGPNRFTVPKDFYDTPLGFRTIPLNETGQCRM